MTIVHFSTEISGGAGSYAKVIHETMLSKDIESVILTREKNNIQNSYTLKPFNKLNSRVRWWFKGISYKFQLDDGKYALFGIEKTPVTASDITQVIERKTLRAFVFYWVSRFIDFKTIYHLRQAYPQLPFLFVCLDEAFLAGGCHYNWGCSQFEQQCNACPSTKSYLKRRKIRQELKKRVELISKIEPIVLYPTTVMRELGLSSEILKHQKSYVFPLGAISLNEKNLFQKGNQKNDKTKLSILIRSSTEYRKGCDLFYEAISKLRDNYPDLKERLEVISIGDKALEEAGLEQFVEYKNFGYVDRQTLLELYRSTDVFIVTSREDAGPLMTNESVAIGKFVISTPVGVAEDLINDGVNGLISNNISADAIFHVLVKILENPSISEVTVTQSEEKLTFEGYVENVMKLLMV